MLAVASCGGHGGSTKRAQGSQAARAEFRCAATLPNGQAPPGESSSPLDFGNGRLWTVLPIDGRLVVTTSRPSRPGTVFGQVNRDGSIAVKFAWWGARSAGRHLRITGMRLDGQANPLRATVAPGLTRAPRFWATRITFTTQGCWQVTATAGGEKLMFAISVMRG